MIVNIKDQTGLNITELNKPSRIKESWWNLLFFPSNVITWLYISKITVVHKGAHMKTPCVDIFILDFRWLLMHFKCFYYQLVTGSWSSWSPSTWDHICWLKTDKLRDVSFLLSSWRRNRHCVIETAVSMLFVIVLVAWILVSVVGNLYRIKTFMFELDQMND